MHSRNIKPGFFVNENLGACSPMARLLFVGMWCLADREGILVDRPRKIAAAVLPFDDKVNGDALMAELDSQEDPDNPGEPALIIRYRVDGKGYIQIANFHKHQRPHRTEAKSKLPPCPERELTCNQRVDTSESNDNEQVPTSDPTVDPRPLIPVDSPHKSPAGDAHVAPPAKDLTLLPPPELVPDPIPAECEAWRKDWPAARRGDKKRIHTLYRHWRKERGMTAKDLEDAAQCYLRLTESFAEEHLKYATTFLSAEGGHVEDYLERSRL